MPLSSVRLGPERSGGVAEKNLWILCEHAFAYLSPNIDSNRKMSYRLPLNLDES